jgi:hypothetical protein
MGGVAGRGAPSGAGGGPVRAPPDGGRSEAPLPPAGRAERHRSRDRGRVIHGRTTPFRGRIGAEEPRRPEHSEGHEQERCDDAAHAARGGRRHGRGHVHRSGRSLEAGSQGGALLPVFELERGPLGGHQHVRGVPEPAVEERRALVHHPKGLRDQPVGLRVADDSLLEDEVLKQRHGVERAVESHAMRRHVREQLRDSRDDLRLGGLSRVPLDEPVDRGMRRLHAPLGLEPLGDLAGVEPLLELRHHLGLERRRDAGGVEVVWPHCHGLRWLRHWIAPSPVSTRLDSTGEPVSTRQAMVAGGGDMADELTDSLHSGSSLAHAQRLPRACGVEVGGGTALSPRAARLAPLLKSEGPKLAFRLRLSSKTRPLELVA